MQGGSMTIRAPIGSVGHGALYHSQSPEVSPSPSPMSQALVHQWADYRVNRASSLVQPA